VNEFLRQINELRNRIVKYVEQLLDEKNQEKLQVATQIMEEERRKAPGLLKRPHEAAAQERIPQRLREFYRETGLLDRLCRRVQDSSIQVWRKLHSHLRELERKSNRLEDLRAAIRHLASFPPESCPTGLINALVSPAIMRHDPRFWDDYEQADPPQPRRRPIPHAEPEKRFLPRKERGGGPVMSMERARLERLRGWLEVTVGFPYQGTPQRVSQEPTPVRRTSFVSWIWPGLGCWGTERSSRVFATMYPRTRRTPPPSTLMTSTSASTRCC